MSAAEPALAVSAVTPADADELGYPTPPDEEARRLAKLSSSDYVVFVAVRDGQAVGLVSLHSVDGLHSSSPAARHPPAT